VRYFEMAYVSDDADRIERWLQDRGCQTIAAVANAFPDLNTQRVKYALSNLVRAKRATNKGRRGYSLITG
jgi:threonine synthase